MGDTVPDPVGSSEASASDLVGMGPRVLSQIFREAESHAKEGVRLRMRRAERFVGREDERAAICSFVCNTE